MKTQIKLGKTKKIKTQKFWHFLAPAIFFIFIKLKLQKGIRKPDDHQRKITTIIFDHFSFLGEGGQYFYINYTIFSTQNSVIHIIIMSSASFSNHLFF